jgi:hypothetical protein
MKIGLWNIDHPESSSGREQQEQRYANVIDYLKRANCDLYILTEANAAMDLPGYFRELSALSPYKSRSRFYGQPNAYHQVAIYSRHPLARTEVIEPFNGLCCEVDSDCLVKVVYGNVITIKDQWDRASSKTYSDRLREQISAIKKLPDNGALVGGDFNLRLGWKAKQFAHREVAQDLAKGRWSWPTEKRDDTVQHVLHSQDLCATLAVDHGVKYDKTTGGGLSDHPFIAIWVST